MQALGSFFGQYSPYTYPLPQITSVDDLFNELKPYFLSTSTTPAKILTVQEKQAFIGAAKQFPDLRQLTITISSREDFISFFEFIKREQLGYDDEMILNCLQSWNRKNGAFFLFTHALYRRVGAFYFPESLTNEIPPNLWRGVCANLPYVSIPTIRSCKTFLGLMEACFRSSSPKTSLIFNEFTTEQHEYFQTHHPFLYLKWNPFELGRIPVKPGSWIESDAKFSNAIKAIAAIPYKLSAENQLRLETMYTNLFGDRVPFDFLEYAKSFSGAISKDEFEISILSSAGYNVLQKTIGSLHTIKPINASH